ncbi:MaoC/PaaZ C-terminal domain-containing protein [Paraburkholderia phymatum]|uniref:MaoC domain protein dehydratase n=1 Tax=Paraburkholderia phymatum (strain DSM 17167 / CIP 108236 / LMG 21445 / STM815) TaxID=391038 RepID=B2JSD3_PARP8|nr:MaoC/PaaZ C-terminal domain-containing protein [Paraburkholderia phymatum]ACC73953.1 MaoC domain protein dehydratase [Paraburkholderia phymatum STM815]
MATVESAVANGLGPNAKFYEEFEVGTEWVTPRRTITEADIVLFTAVTGDQNPVHTDEEFAKNSVFGARLLHGPAVFAIATGLEFRLGIKEGTAIAFLGMTWDMRGPVKAGDTLHVRERVTSKRETKKPDSGIVFFYVAVENQRGEVVQEGEWKVMMKRKPGLYS